MNLMKNMKLTKEQAMEALGIPESNGKNIQGNWQRNSLKVLIAVSLWRGKLQCVT